MLVFKLQVKARDKELNDMDSAFLSLKEKCQEQGDRLKSKMLAQEKKFKALEHRRQLDLEGMMPGLSSVALCSICSFEL